MKLIKNFIGITEFKQTNTNIMYYQTTKNTTFMLCFLLLFQFNPTEKTALLSENFDNNKNGWAEIAYEEGEFKISDGYYYFEHKRERGAWTNAIPVDIPEHTNFEIITKIKTIKSIPTFSFGLVWGRDNDGNHYEFTINKDGEYSLEKQENYQLTSLSYQRWIKSSAIKKGDGAVNELKVLRDGLEMSFYINDTKVQVLRFQKLFGNQIGFKVNRNQKIAVDYLKVNIVETKIADEDDN